MNRNEQHRRAERLSRDFRTGCAARKLTVGLPFVHFSSSSIELYVTSVGHTLQLRCWATR
jgi:hypothetical protein